MGCHMSSTQICRGWPIATLRAEAHSSGIGWVAAHRGQHRVVALSNLEKKSKLVSKKKKRSIERNIPGAFIVPGIRCPCPSLSPVFVLPTIHPPQCSLAQLFIVTVCCHCLLSRLYLWFVIPAFILLTTCHPCCLLSPIHGYHCHQHLQFPL